MKTNNFNLWFRLTISSAIGALVYHLSPAPKVKVLRKKVDDKCQQNGDETKGGMYTLSTAKK